MIIVLSPQRMNDRKIRPGQIALCVSSSTEAPCKLTAVSTPPVEESMNDMWKRACWGKEAESEGKRDSVVLTSWSATIEWVSINSEAMLSLRARLRPSLQSRERQFQVATEDCFSLFLQGNNDCRTLRGLKTIPFLRVPCRGAALSADLLWKLLSIEHNPCVFLELLKILVIAFTNERSNSKFRISHIPSLKAQNNYCVEGISVKLISWSNAHCTYLHLETLSDAMQVGTGNIK